jgi:hypothetical protein
MATLKQYRCNSDAIFAGKLFFFSLCDIFASALYKETGATRACADTKSAIHSPSTGNRKLALKLGPGGGGGGGRLAFKNFAERVRLLDKNVPL